MRTIKTVSILLIALCLLSCTTEKKKVKLITEAYAVALYSGDYDKAMSYSTPEIHEIVEMASTMAAETQEDLEKILSSKIEVSFDSVVINNDATKAVAYFKLKGVEGAYNYLNGTQNNLSLKKIVEIDRWRVTIPELGKDAEQNLF